MTEVVAYKCILTAEEYKLVRRAAVEAGTSVNKFTYRCVLDTIAERKHAEDAKEVFGQIEKALGVEVQHNCGE